LASERFFEGGNNFVAETIAGGIQGGVGGVLTPRVLFAEEIGAQIFASPIEQGTPDFQFATLPGPRGFLAHATESAASAAPEEMMEDGFDLVVSVVSQKQTRSSFGPGAVEEKIVAGEASGGFEGEFAGLGQCRDIKASRAKTESELLGKTTDEILVVGGRSTAKLVMQVAENNLAMACRVQEPGERG
jgi:hypothetical protein